MFGWLVGDTEVWSTDVIDPDGKIREQKSVLHLKKCRFLEAVSARSSEQHIGIVSYVDNE